MNTILRQFSIRQRLLGSLALLSVVIVVMGSWAALALRSSQQASEQLQADVLKTSEATANLVGAFERIRRLEQSLLLNGNNPNEASDLLKAWTAAVKSAQAGIASSLPAEALAGPLAGTTTGLEAYAKELAPVLEQVANSRMDGTAGAAYAERGKPHIEGAQAQLQEWAKTSLSQRAERDSQDKARTALHSKLQQAALLLLLAGFAVLMWHIVESICQPLREATQVAGSIAQGDLSRTVQAQGRDEVAQFMRQLNAMQGALHAIVSDVRNSADSISTASREVAQGNLDLSTRTEHAAGNLQTTTASMQQLASTAIGSADAAAQASSLAQTASSLAGSGGQAVAEVVKTMGEITASSRRIADITGVIDGIAFQTNILALNAAVEAARAGEQGRGFAVVAAEVRTLAHRAGAASREIKTLIGSSVEKVESGSSQVVTAGERMQEIVAAVERVHGIVREMSAASSEQTSGINQVSVAVHNLDTMTQQNAALVEQSAAAADSLQAQAHRLSDSVARFKLGAHARVQ